MRGFSKTAFSVALVAAVLSFGGVAYAESVATVQTKALSFGAWCLFIGGLLFLVVLVVWRRASCRRAKRASWSDSAGT